jgi:hypothetical protein
MPVEIQAWIVTTDLVCHLYLLPCPIWAILLTPVSAIPMQVLAAEQPPLAADRGDVWQAAPRAQPDPLATLVAGIAAFLRQLGSIAQLTNLALAGPFAIHN